MACRIHQLNKSNGVVYVYESSSYWDQIKKQPRNKKVCIGKLDANGKFIPSKRLKPEQAAVRDPEVAASCKIIGPSVVLNSITQRLGLHKLLYSCCPDYYQEIMYMAYYLVHEGRSLSHCKTWCQSHAPNMAISLSSQRITNILKAITVNTKQTFLSQWIAKNDNDDYLCYDITSISSYTEYNEYVRYGYNRDKEKLPQLNLGVVFGQNSGLPLYFQSCPGSINDVTTLCNL